MKKLYVLFFMALTIIISGCEDGASEKTELTISAAASLREALEETGQRYMDEHPDIKIVYNFGGSGSLQQQISQGAPVDVFISAAENKYNQLLSKQLINENHSVKLLGNELVLITHKDHKKVDILENLIQPDIERISIGTPETVPAGQYAKQTLISLGLWEQLKFKIINTKDVRQVLSYVETGNVDAGIVYKTDAMTSNKVNMAPISGSNVHDPIIYPAGVVTTSKNPKEAISFFNFLTDKETMAIFKKYGFKAALD